jgi:Mrp family chromosome partitioning ATPase
VLDLPPVNLVSDAMSVSGYITGMVVVAREEYIEKKDLKACFRQLELSGVKILGCVMTCAKRKSGSYGKYSKYKRYKYYKYYSHYYGHYGNNHEIPKESGKDLQQ